MIKFQFNVKKDEKYLLKKELWVQIKFTIASPYIHIEREKERDK